MSRLGHRQVLGAVLAASALSLGACGSASSSSGSGSSPASGSSSTSSTAASPASPSSDSGSLGKEIFAKTYDAAVQAKTAHITTSFSVGGRTFGGAGDVSYAASQPSTQMTMTSEGKKVEIRLIGGMLYEQVPGVTPAGKFLAINLDDPSSATAKQFAPIRSSLDTLSTFKKLSAAVKSVKKVGTENVTGAETTHYLVTVDGAALGKAMGLGAAGAKIPSELSYDLWLDSKNLMRQVKVSIDGADVTSQATDWGKPVDISAPPASSQIKPPAGQ